MICATSSNPTDIQLFRKMLDVMSSSVELEGLNEVVTLVPCAHKVHSITLKQLMNREEKKCTQCKIIITGYLTIDQSREICGYLSQMTSLFKAKYGLGSQEA